MNTEQSKIHRITPENPPVFPCWLWIPLTAHNRPHWEHFPEPVNIVTATHWHSDQAEPPTERPGEHYEVISPAPDKLKVDDLAAAIAEELWKKYMKAVYDDSPFDNKMVAAIIARHLAPLVEENERMVQNLISIMSGTEAKNATLHRSVPEMLACQVMQEKDALRARVAELKGDRDQWRMSSVCREKQAEVDRLRAENARLKSENEFNFGILKDCHRILEMTNEQSYSLIPGEIEEWLCSHARLKDRIAKYTDPTSKLIAELAALRARLAEPEKDKERLDWMERGKASLETWSWSSDCRGGPGFTINGYRALSLRAAIDAAKEGEK